MKRPILATLGGAALFLGFPAAAQLAAGYSGVEGLRSGTDDEYWLAIRAMGPCLVRGRPELSRALLATPRGSAAESQALRSLFKRSTTCLQDFSRMGLATYVVRGALAEAFYEAGHKTAPSVASMTPVVLKATPANIDDFADCQVRKDPTSIHLLLAETQLHRPDEEERVTAMAKEFRSCLPAGKRVMIEPTAVRLALAEAMYRGSMGNPIAGGRSDAAPAQTASTLKAID